MLYKEPLNGALFVTFYRMVRDMTLGNMFQSDEMRKLNAVFFVVLNM